MADDLLGIGALASAGVGLAENISARQQALQELNQTVQSYQAIGIPSIQAQQLALQDYQSAGKLTPELEQAFTQGNSQLSSVQTDPQYKQAQLSALNSLQGIANHGGLTIQDQANTNNVLSQLQQANAGNQGAIMQNMAQRGVGGSGFELAQRLSNAQSAGNTAAQQGTNIAAQAQARALQAISQGGQLGGQMQAQQYNQLANAAQAQDAINRFNTQNSQAVANQNTGYQNQAQQANLQNAQNIANANTGLSNYQQQYNSQLQQQQFQNNLSVASGAANARAGVANQLTSNGNSYAATAGGIAQGLGQAYAAENQPNNANNKNDGSLSTQISGYKVPQYNTDNFGNSSDWGGN